MNRRKSEGITLITLVVTIIVLIILAGVSVSTLVGKNGILNKAQDARDKINIASEKEAIEFIMLDMKTDLIIDGNIDKSKIKGEELFTKNLENSSRWKIITETVDGKVAKKYGTDWYYLKKGTDLFGTKLNNDYIVNYLTGEVINFEEDKHKFLSVEDFSEYYSTDNLILNVDPGIMDEYNNLSDEQKKNYDIANLGSGVELIGYNGDDGKVDLSQVFTKSSYKFDGQDDYIKISFEGKEKIKNIVENGFTFEYYGIVEPGVSKNTSTNELLMGNYSKGLFGFWNKQEKSLPLFRAFIDFNHEIRPFWWSNVYGNILENWKSDYVSSKSELYGPNSEIGGAYWNQRFSFDKEYLNNEIYLTLVVNPKIETMVSGIYNEENYNNLCIEQDLYINGEKIAEGKLNKKLWDFLLSEDLDYDLNSFIIGRCSYGGASMWHYIKGNCYSLRFYDTALTEEKIKTNYQKTKDYHKILESE